MTTKPVDHELSDSSSADPTYRQRCYTCFRPLNACFCEAIPRINNRTDVLILQHVKERFHAFNTARIVKSALEKCRLIVDQTPNLASTRLPIATGAGVLYPGPEAIPLEGLPERERPPQLVILDGTWHHAKTLMREIPSLQQLPRFCLTPDRPSNYKIRRPPSDTALSTLEAVSAALTLLEPDTPRVAELLSAFERMVEGQLQHPTRNSRMRKRSALPRPSVNVPGVLLREPQNVVVAYGETSFGGPGKSRRNRSLVYWVAERLVSGETFAATIQPQDKLSPEFLSHLQLDATDFNNASSPEQFRQSWHSFIRPHETLCVFNASTANALKSYDADFLPVVSLKAINLHKTCRSLDEVLQKLELQPDPVVMKGRAGQRLANAGAYARYLAGANRAQAAAGETDRFGSS